MFNEVSVNSREFVEKEEKFVRPLLATASFVPPTTTTNNNNNNNNNRRSSSNNNNMIGNTDISRERKASSIPPKEALQDDISRAFTDELMMAKSRLKVSRRVSEERDSSRADGSPPPPPPPVLPAALKRGTAGPPAPPPAPALPKNQGRVLQPAPLDPREDLLLAIRQIGGIAGLRKTRN